MTKNVLKFTDTAIRHDRMINACNNIESNYAINFEGIFNTVEEIEGISYVYQDYWGIFVGKHILLGEELIY